MRLSGKGRIAEFEALIEKAKPLQEAAIEIITSRKTTENIELLADEVTRLGAEIPDPLDACRFIDEAAQALNLPAWALQEKTHLKRDKKERLIERKKSLKISSCTSCLHTQASFPTTNWNRSKISLTITTRNKSCLTKS